MRLLFLYFAVFAFIQKLRAVIPAFSGNVLAVQALIPISRRLQA